MILTNISGPLSHCTGTSCIFLKATHLQAWTPRWARRSLNQEQKHTNHLSVMAIRRSCAWVRRSEAELILKLTRWTSYRDWAACPRPQPHPGDFRTHTEDGGWHPFIRWESHKEPTCACNFSFFFFFALFNCSMGASRGSESAVLYLLLVPALLDIPQGLLALSFP